MKTELLFKLIVGSFLAFVLVVGSAFSDSQAGKPVKGETVYKKNCSVCHRKNGKGIPNTFPPLAKSDYLINHSKEEIITIILKGQKGKLKVNGRTYNNVMIPFKKLSNEEIAAVLTYVTSNFGNSGEKYIPEEVGKVRGSLKK